MDGSGVDTLIAVGALFIGFALAGRMARNLRRRGHSPWWTAFLIFVFPFGRRGRFRHRK